MRLPEIALERPHLDVAPDRFLEVFVEDNDDQEGQNIEEPVGKRVLLPEEPIQESPQRDQRAGDRRNVVDPLLFRCFCLQRFFGHGPSGDGHFPAW